MASLLLLPQALGDDPEKRLATRGRRTSSSIECPWSLWCRPTKNAGHRSEMYSADSTSSTHNRQTAFSDTLFKFYQRCC